MPDFALPDNQKVPAGSAKLFLLTLIAYPIRLQFWEPKFQPGFWQAGQPTRRGRVAVPKASVNEYRLAATRKKYVRLSRDVFATKRKAKSKGVNKAPNQQLRPGVLTANKTHPLASLDF
jgi:hypothetical protein